MGHVYVLSNEAMPGLLKVGFTDRTPEQRALELYTTGTPAPFTVEFAVELVGDTYQIEQRIHRRLSRFRLDQRREFFRMELPDAVQHVASFIVEEKHPVINLHGKYSNLLPEPHEYAKRWREIVTETQERKNRTAEAKRIVELRNEYKKWYDENSRITKGDWLTILGLCIFPGPVGFLSGAVAIDLAERVGFLQSKVEGNRGFWFFAGLALGVAITFALIIRGKIKSRWGEIAPDKFKEVSD